MTGWAISSHIPTILKMVSRNLSVRECASHHSETATTKSGWSVEDSFISHVLHHSEAKVFIAYRRQKPETTDPELEARQALQEKQTFSSSRMDIDKMVGISHPYNRYKKLSVAHTGNWIGTHLRPEDRNILSSSNPIVICEKDWICEMIAGARAR